MRHKQNGFTLVELLVVVLIVGVLAAFSIPQYNKSVETSRAEGAASTLTMIAQANRMFQLDSGAYVGPGKLTSTCNSQNCCSGSCPNPQSVCQLVACKYVAQQKWVGPTDDGYYFMAGTTVNCGGLTASCSNPATAIACARRQMKSPSLPYSGWGYLYCSDGSLKPAGGAPEVMQ